MYVITFSTWFTLLRIGLTPCVMAVIYAKSWVLAVVIFLLASATDFLDGYFARLYHQESELGRILDPVADKILILGTLWALYDVSGQVLIPFWFVLLLFGKEFVLGAVGLMLLKKWHGVLSPSLLAKVVTALFMVFLVYLMLIHFKVVTAYCVDGALQFFALSMMCIMADYGYKIFLKLR